MSTLTNWAKMKIFNGIDLNDSFVVDWSFDKNNLVINLIASIWPDSQYYDTPKKDEYTCYKKAIISFTNTTSITGLLPKESVKSSKDIDGSIDFGNIDSLTELPNGFEITGDFGQVKITGGILNFNITESHTINHDYN